jgi:hypothetical protein
MTAQRSRAELGAEWHFFSEFAGERHEFRARARYMYAGGTC